MTEEEIWEPCKNCGTCPFFRLARTQEKMKEALKTIDKVLKDTKG